MDNKIEAIKPEIKKFFKTKAGSKVGSGYCDDCHASLVPGNTYQCGDQLWCEACTDKFLNASYIDWSQALKNLNSWFGPGVPSYIQDMVSKEKPGAPSGIKTGMSAAQVISLLGEPAGKVKESEIAGKYSGFNFVGLSKNNSEDKEYWLYKLSSGELKLTFSKRVVVNIE